MIEAVIFDMDGVLIDSEPIWQQTEIEVFREIGIHITPDMQVPTKGLRTDEMVDYWYKKYPWSHPPISEIMSNYDGRMVNKFMNEVELFEGAREVVEYFYNLNLPLALASSSSMDLINTFLERFDFRRYFSVIYSAENEPYGKPHPSVFLETARLLNVDPVNCLAIEDSFHGLIAAKAARMKVIVFPEKDEFDETRFDAADLKISHLRELTGGIFEKLSR